VSPSAPALTQAMKGLNPMTKATRVHSTPPTSTPTSQNSLVDPTRRRLLTVAAGGAVAAMAITTTAQAAGEGINLSANKINALAPKTPSKEITPSQGMEGDPIYAVIEAHRRACTEHVEAIHIHMAFEEVGMTGEKLEKYNSLVAETDAAYDRLDDVGCDLINTKPTTFAGILALCRYVQPFFGESDPDELPNYILFDDDSTEYPAEALFRVIGSAIEALIKTPAEKAVRA
jgi:hypothetical protein